MFCAPGFIFLAGTSAFLYGMKRTGVKETAAFLFTRGLWLILVELVIVNFAWTFDITYSFRILQVIWAIGMILVFGHNLLDSVTVQGSSALAVIWHVLHQPGSIVVVLLYPICRWYERYRESNPSKWWVICKSPIFCHAIMPPTHPAHLTIERS